MFAVTWQSSNYNKNVLGHKQNIHEETKRTCRTVTGILTPLSSYMLVIPRFRAMRPVRIEFGVHFGAGLVVGVANFAMLELKYLTLVDGERVCSRNIREDGGKPEGVRRNGSDLVGTRLGTPRRETVMSESAPTSDTKTPATNVVLHIWPGAFGLASMEPTCLAAVLYLQIAIPERFTLEESTTPDYSPNGTRKFSDSYSRAEKQM